MVNKFVLKRSGKSEEIIVGERAGDKNGGHIIY